MTVNISLRGTDLGQGWVLTRPLTLTVEEDWPDFVVSDGVFHRYGRGANLGIALGDYKADLLTYFLALTRSTLRGHPDSAPEVVRLSDYIRRKIVFVVGAPNTALYKRVVLDEALAGHAVVQMPPTADSIENLMQLADLRFCLVELADEIVVVEEDALDATARAELAYAEALGKPSRRRIPREVPYVPKPQPER